jgi:hypothetical protein
VNRSLGRSATKEAIMSDTHEVRRHNDGSIDVDFYRKRAQALRRVGVAQSGRAWRRGFLRHLRELAGRIWPDRHPSADRASAAMRLAAVGCGAREDCN